MSVHATDDERAERRMVHRAFDRLTGRDGPPLDYALMDDTPVGVLGLAAGPAGLRRITYVKDEDDFLRRLFADFPDRPLERTAALDPVRRELDRYFAGKSLNFDTRIDLSDVSEFQRRVLHELLKVTAGHVTTYSRLAERAGRPKAARAVGNAMHDNPVPIIVPCHRCLRGDGSLGGYGGGLPAKEWLLKHEGAVLV
jgi:methylated-DNA-[protein]-cysteine S-methyltransferase